MLCSFVAECETALPLTAKGRCVVCAFPHGESRCVWFVRCGWVDDCFVHRVKENKFWPHVGRLDNVYGDRYGSSCVCVSHTHWTSLHAAASVCPHATAHLRSRAAAAHLCPFKVLLPVCVVVRFQVPGVLVPSPHGLRMKRLWRHSSRTIVLSSSCPFTQSLY